MIRPRRLHFQLTPLLDLLLIVIFAQYLDVRETAAEHRRSGAAQVQQLAADKDALADRVVRLENELQLHERRIRERDSQVDRLRQEAAGLRDAIEQLTRTMQRQSGDLQREHERREELGRILQSFFEIPDPVLQKLANDERQPESLRTPQETAELVRQIRRLRDADPRAVIEHFTTVGELLKRCDLWRLHIADNGMTTLHAAGRRFSFTANTPSDFAAAVFQRYKALPEPKSLVVILFSYGDVRFEVYDAALRGLPQAVSQMQVDRQGRTRFEYTILGFDPDGPTGPTAPQDPPR